MIIGIEIDEIIRAKYSEFDKYYAEEFGENLANEGKYTLDYKRDFHWEDTEEIINYLNEELPENISPIEYQVDPNTGEAPVDHMAFRKKTEKRSADENYRKFLYEDYLLEIFGLSQKIYKDVDMHIEEFYTKYKDTVDIRIICKENWFTIPPTLFFLSKVRPRFKHFHFVENENEMWDIADVMITTDPKVIKSKPKNKKVIMLKRPYNYNIEDDQIFDDLKNNVDFVFMGVFDLINNVEFENLIKENEK